MRYLGRGGEKKLGRATGGAYQPSAAAHAPPSMPVRVGRFAVAAATMAQLRALRDRARLHALLRHCMQLGAGGQGAEVLERLGEGFEYRSDEVRATVRIVGARTLEIRWRACGDTATPEGKRVRAR